MVTRDRTPSHDDSYLGRGDMGIKESPSMPPGESTSSSSNSPSQAQQLRVQATTAPLLLRTNFGKSRGYVPPANGVWNKYSPSRSVNSPNSDFPDDESDVPFDQKDEAGPNDSRKTASNISAATTPPRQSNVSPEAAPNTSAATTLTRRSNLTDDPLSPVDQTRPFDEQSYGVGDELEPPSLRKDFALPSPPRFGGDSLVRQSQTDAERSPGRPKPDARYHSDHGPMSLYRMASPRISRPTPLPLYPYGDGTTDGSATASTDVNLNTPPRQGGEVSYEASGGTGNASSGREKPEGEEDDSLFDFEENEKRRRKKWRNRRAQLTTETTTEEEEDDDTSVEYSPTNLTQRAHEAWRRKSARGASSKTDSSLDAPAVSFGKNDTIHRYVEPGPGPDEEDEEEDEEEEYTFTGHSLNSEYTKSAESEVEDLIKDIFMIGNPQETNPGRRKIKYNPAVREKLHRDMEATDEDTLETNEEEEDFPASSRRKKGFPKLRQEYTDSSFGDDTTEEEKKDDGNPFTYMWNYVEGGISAALGFEEDEQPCEPATKGKRKKSSSSTRSSSSDEEKRTGGGFLGMFGLSDVLYGSHSSENNGDNTSTQPDSLVTALSLEDDLRLVDLAVQAARSTHKLKGYDYDETYEIDINSDIKFSVVDLTTPLGLIFQENEVGCWITKVLSDGSAVSTGQVRVGDQLAAIDGISAINMKVDQIAKVIKTREGSFELTFLRYVGPLRPAAGAISEEGYEVSTAGKSSTRRLASSRRPIAAQSNAEMPERRARGGFLGFGRGASARESRANSAVSSSNAVKATKGDEHSNKRRFRLFGKKK